MRQVPQDLTAEQSLLGAMLVDPNCIPEVIEQVRADDFYAEENKRIFETIYSMFNGAQRIDPVTVLDMLTRMGYYDEAGGRAYLFQLMEVTPGARNVNEYVRIVRDKSLLRQLADAGSEIQQNALEAHGEASGIAVSVKSRDMRVTFYTSTQRPWGASGGIAGRFLRNRPAYIGGIRYPL